MLSRRRLGLASAAALGLAACDRLTRSELESPGRISFSILPAPPRSRLVQTWRLIVADMAKAASLDVTLVIPRSYAALIAAMAAGQLDAGWFSNETGLEAVRRAGGEVFARMIGLNGADGYQSVLVVRTGGPVTLDRVLKCDRTLSLGLGDPLSTSGYVAPIAYFFGDNELPPRKCFRSVRTGAPAGLAAVADGTLDVAASNTMAMELDREAGGALADKVEPIWRSPTLPEDPIVCRKRLDPAVKEALRQFFLTYGQGRGPDAVRQQANLATLRITGFAPADDSHLTMVREIEARERWVLARWSGEPARAAAAKKALDDDVAQRETLEARIRAQAGTQ